MGTLDDLVAKERGADVADVGRGRELKLEPVELHPHPVDGEELAKEISATVARFVALPDHAAVAVTLWVLHTHSFDASPITPRLAIVSPVHRCGKSTLLGILRALVAKAMGASNVTPSAIFRTVEMVRPCLLVDEADTFLKDNEELRGVLNSGHERTGTVIRSEERAGQHVPVMFSTWSPVAIAMIGKPPVTLADRSISIKMERRLPGQTVERWRSDRMEEFTPIARRCARWAADHHKALGEADPVAHFCPRPMLKLLHRGDDGRAGHLRWDRRAVQPPILDILQDHDAPHEAARPLTTNKLARLLKPFGVAPTRREYKLTAFDGPWVRDLPPFKASKRTDARE